MSTDRAYPVRRVPRYRSFNDHARSAPPTANKTTASTPAPASARVRGRSGHKPSTAIAVNPVVAIASSVLKRHGNCKLHRNLSESQTPTLHRVIMK